MTDLKAAPEGASGERLARRLLLVWQNPQSRRFVRVGRLEEMDTGRFVFTYEPGVLSNGFEPLAEFPDLRETY